MKKYKGKFVSTSFHGSEFKATPAQLRKAFGEPASDQNDGSDKVNLEWELETNSGKMITIYDWKEYRRINDNDMICWHIGGAEQEDTEEALQEIKTYLKGIS
jgi:hypothetical protein